MTAVQTRQIATGLFWLAAGVMTYVLGRPAETTHFLPPALSLPLPLPSVGAWLSGVLPPLAHVMAFSLLSAGVLGGGKRAAAGACLAWALINTGFEMGQHPQAGSWLAAGIPAWFDRLWLLDNTRAFFQYGTFDHADLAAIWIGALAAYLLLLRSFRGRSKKGHDEAVA